MNVSRFCDLLPSTGSATGLSAAAIALIVTMAGVGVVIFARRSGMRSAAMALLPVAMLVPAATTTNTNAQQVDTKPTTQQCVERPSNWNIPDPTIPELIR